MSDDKNKRSVDVPMIVLALFLLGAALIGLNGNTWWLTTSLLPWAIAAIVAAIGLGLIISSLPRKGK